MNVDHLQLWKSETGITFRAYIAVKAMAGLLANPHCPRVDGDRSAINGPVVAEISVKLADQLIAELEKQ